MSVSPQPSDHPTPGPVMIALVAALLASVGDFGLLYVGQQAGDPRLGWPALPSGALAVSQWLGAFTIPLYAVGYIALSSGLPEPGRAIVYWLGLYTSALGGVIHAVTALAISVSPVDTTKAADAFSFDPEILPYLVPFVLVTAVGLLIAAIAWSIAVLRHESAFPRWLGILNPLSCVMIVLFAGLPFSLGRLFVVPMAPNIGSFLFFAFAFVVVRRRPSTARPSTS